MRKKVASVKQRMLARFAGRARRAARLHGRVDVLITSSAEMRSLNLRFRGNRKPTDVLSFPSPSGKSQTVAGDIAISADIAATNAKRLGHSVADELKILILHGVLHLAGYDHETDNGRMARKERKLRRELRLPESLIERAGRSASPSNIRADRRAR
jgi:probable rRNA maturation factor